MLARVDLSGPQIRYKKTNRKRGKKTLELDNEPVTSTKTTLDGNTQSAPSKLSSSNHQCLNYCIGRTARMKTYMAADPMPFEVNESNDMDAQCLGV